MSDELNIEELLTDSEESVDSTQTNEESTTTSNLQIDELRIQSILLKLPGFVTDTTELTDLEYDKKITNEEIEDAYNSALNYATSFCRQEKLPDDNVIVDTAIDFWTAGLIWKKYDIRPNDQEDETSPIGYGDNLIIQAKQMLKPFKFYEFEVW